MNKRTEDARNWRKLAELMRNNGLPEGEICEAVFDKYSKCFASKESAGNTIKSFLRKIKKNEPKDFGDEVNEARKKMEQSATIKKDKDLAKKMAIADFIIEGCRDALSERPYPEIKLNFPNYEPNTKEQTIVLELSDIQAGTFISKESTGGLNEFNWETLIQYFDNLFIGLEQLVRPLQKVIPTTSLHIHMLGDMVEDSQIFPGQEQNICKDLFHQATGTADLIENFLVKCCHIFKTISITAVCGNHGRVGKKGENLHWVNWDRVVYEFVRREMKNFNQISWKYDDSWWQIDEIYGYKFYLTHGDDIRCWAGIPYYGVDRSAQRETELLRLLNESYDYFMIGHLHTPSMLPGVATVKYINGCFPGGTIFSMKNMGVASKPQQWMLVVHPDWGVTHNCSIYLKRD